MEIRKKVLIVIIIAIILLGFFLISTTYMYKKIENVKREEHICDEIRFTLTSLDRNFWKLKNTFTENNELNFTLYNNLLVDLNKLEKLIIFLDLPIIGKQRSEIDKLSSFLNQFRQSAEKLRKKREDLSFVQTNMDASYFSFISLYYRNAKLEPLYSLLLLDKMYINYRINRRKEGFNALTYIIDNLSKNSYFKDNLDKLSNLKFLISSEHEIYKEISKINIQLDYISKRFEEIFSNLSSELTDAILLINERLFISRAKALGMHFWGTFFFFLGFIVYMSWLLLKRVLQPIGDLNKVVIRISEGDMNARFIPKSNDEIARLGLAFNEMLNKIKITNEKLEKEMQKAKASSKAKSEFLKRISHEFRTPLNGVMGFAEVLLDAELPKTQRNYIEIILKEAERLKDLIDEVLTFSEMEDNKLSYMESEINLAEKIKEIIDIKREKASEKGLKISFLNKIGTNDKVIGDPSYLVKIFDQLIDNAIKFTEKGEVRVVIAEKREEKNDILYYFYIKDTGIGIESEDIDKVFDPFYQSDPILTRRFSGLGLGLTVVKRLIEHMGGHIWIDSTPGQGTIYNFTLKFKKPK